MTTLHFLVICFNINLGHFTEIKLKNTREDQKDLAYIYYSIFSIFKYFCRGSKIVLSLTNILLDLSFFDKGCFY
jgi:hypothetical protein